MHEKRIEARNSASSCKRIAFKKDLNKERYEYVKNQVS